MSRGCSTCIACIEHLWFPLTNLHIHLTTVMPLPGLPKQLYICLTLSTSSYSHYHLSKSTIVFALLLFLYGLPHNLFNSQSSSSSLYFAHPSLSLLLEPNTFIQILAKHFWQYFQAYIPACNLHTSFLCCTSYLWNIYYWYNDVKSSPNFRKPLYILTLHAI